MTWLQEAMAKRDCRSSRPEPEGHRNLVSGRNPVSSL